MTRRIPKRQIYRWIVMITVLLVLAEVVPNIFTVSEDKIYTLNPLQTKQVDTYVAMTQLLISLATGAAGAVTLIIFNRYDKEPLPPAQLRRAMAAWALIGLSLYAGHLSYQNLLKMLSDSYLNLMQARVIWPSRVQFWSFLLAIVVVADFVHTSLVREYTE
jgi:hypothetical protein